MLLNPRAALSLHRMLCSPFCIPGLRVNHPERLLMGSSFVCFNPGSTRAAPGTQLCKASFPRTQVTPCICQHLEGVQVTKPRSVTQPKRDLSVFHGPALLEQQRLCGRAVAATSPPSHQRLLSHLAGGESPGNAAAMARESKHTLST